VSLRPRDRGSPEIYSLGFDDPLSGTDAAGCAKLSFELGDEVVEAADVKKSLGNSLSFRFRRYRQSLLFDCQGCFPTQASNLSALVLPDWLLRRGGCRRYCKKCRHSSIHCGADYTRAIIAPRIAQHRYSPSRKMNTV
jgi:hypothetical protein